MKDISLDPSPRYETRYNVAFDPEAKDQPTRRRVDTMATNLHTREPGSRRDVAALVREHDFTAHIGGHHVAVLVGNTRVALITPNPDHAARDEMIDWD